VATRRRASKPDPSSTDQGPESLLALIQNLPDLTPEFKQKLLADPRLPEVRRALLQLQEDPRFLREPLDLFTALHELWSRRMFEQHSLEYPEISAPADVDAPREAKFSAEDHSLLPLAESVENHFVRIELNRFRLLKLVSSPSDTEAQREAATRLIDSISQDTIKMTITMLLAAFKRGMERDAIAGMKSRVGSKIGASRGGKARAARLKQINAELIRNAVVVRERTGRSVQRIAKELAPNDPRRRSQQTIARIIGPAVRRIPAKR